MSTVGNQKPIVRLSMVLVILFFSSIVDAQSGSFLTVAEGLTKLGKVQLKRQQPDSALQSYQKAAEIFLDNAEKHNSQEFWKKYFACQRQIGACFKRKRDYSKAMDVLNTALAEARRRIGWEQAVVADLLSERGWIYEIRSDVDAAFRDYSDALEIRKKVLGENHPDVAISLNGIGLIYRRAGDYQNAVNYYQKALSIYEENFGPDYLRVGMLYGNIAVAYKYLGRYQESLRNSRKSLAVFRKNLGDNHPYIATNINNLGTAHFENNNPDSALVFYYQALKLRKKVLKDSLNPDFSQSYINMATAYAKKMMMDSARHYFQKALRIDSTNYGMVHPYISETFLGMGQMYALSRDYQKGLYYYQRALRSLSYQFDNQDILANPTPEEVLSQYHLLQAMQGKADIFRRHGLENPENVADLQHALDSYKQILSLVDMMQRGYKAQESRLLSREIVYAVSRKTVVVLSELHQRTGKKKFVEDAFQIAEQARTTLLLKAFSESQAKKFANIPAGLVEQEHQLKVDLTFYDQNLTEELSKGEKADQKQIRKFRNRLFDRKHEYEKLIQRFENEYPQYYHLKYEPPQINIADIQHTLLEKNSALVEYLIGDSLIHMFVLTKTEVSLVSREKPSNLDKQIKFFRQTLIHKNASDFYRAGHQLYQLLLEPLTEKIAGKPLLIIPDGLLSYIPFETLPVNTIKGRVRDFEKIRYLLDQQPVSYGYSAALLKKTFQKDRQALQKDFLAFAPVFSEVQDYSRLTRSVELSNDTNYQYDGTRGFLLGKGKIAPIPGTEKEVKSILKLFTRHHRSGWLFLREKATEAELKTLDISNYKYLHLATHAFVNEKYPQLSGLILAQNSESQEDGILYAGEIYNLNLNAELVVLSACETGLGQVARGEGIIGLTRGLLYAGAKNLLVSLWRVADESTSKLMVEFYRQLIDGKSLSVALRDAKLKLRHSQDFKNPYYWSPFVLIGK